MNDQIVKLFGFILVLFALLVFFTSKVTVFNASALDSNPLNHLTAIHDAKIKRGAILADNGTVLAKSVPAGGGEWTRTYPQGSLFAQTVGYWRGSGDDAGLESYYAGRLNGRTSSISSVFGPLSSTLQVGDTLHTSLDPKAQRAARAGLAGRVGAVVALNPRTGSVLALYANPTFDPNATNIVNAACRKVDCLFDQATQSAQPPGSTFKIVTAAPAMNTGKFTPNSILNGNSPRLVSGVPLHNDANQSWGDISVATALTNSVNTVWAQIGEAVGVRTMTEYMKRFGFYTTPPIDLPSNELRASDVLSPAGVAYPPGSPNEDIGRIAIGQGGLAVSPLQMAMVASAVADNGKLMRPHLVSRITNSQGATVQTIAPRLYHQVMSARAAQEINGMMRNVVDEGTGTPAQLGGIPFAGKTGTATVGADGANITDPWFIGFAPANDPKVAVAVMLEHTQGDYGGQTAGPIAASVVRTLLQEGK
ncbi:MAG TPA: penicillin-binding protein 2 [Solirubrobacteraceae bacterium]|nr:penicillin-binding protein 2 [Solirubrobacteraceae bacterium]